MNIFTKEIKANSKSLVIWCIGILAMIGGGMSKFAAYSNSGESMNELLKVIPKSLLNIMGLSSFDLTKAIEFYGVLFLYLILISSIHAVILGANIIAKEENEKTAEFLFTKPISRSKVITLKLLAAFFNIFILNMVTFVLSFFIVNYFNKGDEILENIAILMVGMFIVQFLFMCIGSMLASATKKPHSAASTASGILLVTFILSMIINMNDKLENLKYITPFKYFEAESVLFGKGLNFHFILLSALIITVSLYSTYMFYKKRDLNI
ncbi:ABC transporter permease subunit [Clostridium aestuarii]|uniref:ABC transporter permease subunit n=1 Tax=Clostridium aestuarii TaxID=338193 RepID=A0ABT4CVU0_9CLOT|nr:ABC transporter permease subunit [Clostridium aestuarii]MCY6483093.1 ABC transporter permease subunit [Clostridium aestuarii]